MNKRPSYRKPSETLNEQRMDYHNDNLFILMQGIARTGKTTIANYLTENYDYQLIDAGSPFKCLLGMGLPTFGNLVLREGREQAFEYLIENREEYLTEYEYLKLSNDPEEFRNLTIGIAEFFRCAYPDVWPKMALQISPEIPLNIGFALDRAERFDYAKYYRGRFYDVKLECRNSGIQDTRKPFPLEGLGTSGGLIIRYDIKQSLEVAEVVHKIATETLEGNHILHSDEIREINL